MAKNTQRTQLALYDPLDPNVPLEFAGPIWTNSRKDNKHIVDAVRCFSRWAEATGYSKRAVGLFPAPGSRTETDTVEVTLTLDRRQFLRLSHLANAVDQNANGSPRDVSKLIGSLLASLDQGIHRSGSRERECFAKLFGESLDVACEEMYAAGDQPDKRNGGSSNEVES